MNQFGAVRDVSVPKINVEENRMEEIGIIKGDYCPMVGA